jgi:hypothetical protein
MHPGQLRSRAKSRAGPVPGRAGVGPGRKQARAGRRAGSIAGRVQEPGLAGAGAGPDLGEPGRSKSESSIHKGPSICEGPSIR